MAGTLKSTCQACGEPIHYDPDTKVWIGAQASACPVTLAHSPLPYTILALGPQCWAKGQTLTEARAQLRRENGGAPKQWIAYYVPVPPHMVWVDELGRITWDLIPGITRGSIQPVIIDRKD